MYGLNTDTEKMITCRYDGLFQYDVKDHCFDGPCSRITIIRRLYDTLLPDGNQEHLAYVGALMLVAMQSFCQPSSYYSAVIDKPTEAMAILLPGFLGEARFMAYEITTHWETYHPKGVAVLPETVLNAAHGVYYDYWQEELAGNGTFLGEDSYDSARIFNQPPCISSNETAPGIPE